MNNAIYSFTFNNNVETKCINSWELSKIIMTKLFFNMIERTCPRTGSFSLNSRYFHLKWFSGSHFFSLVGYSLSFCFFQLSSNTTPVLVIEHKFSFTCGVGNVFYVSDWHCQTEITFPSQGVAGLSFLGIWTLSQSRCKNNHVVSMSLSSGSCY